MRRKTLLSAAWLAAATLVTPSLAAAQTASPADTTTSTTSTLLPPDTTVATTPTTAVASPTSTSTTAAPTTTSTTVAPSPPPSAVATTPPPIPRVRGVGDSVFLSAQSQTVSRLQPEYRPRFESALGVSIGDMVPTARRMADTDPAAMVIGLGNPDVEAMAGPYGFIVYQWAQDMLRVTSQVPCVVWINLKQRGVNSFYTPRWEQASTGFDNWLVGAASPGGLYYRNLHVLDWNSATISHPEWFLTDGLHLNASGQAAYAGRIDRYLNRVCPP